MTESFTYKSRNSTHAGNLVNTANNTAANFNVTYSYTYNGRWDILSVNDGSYKTTYTYGTESQLIRENNPRAGKTWVWTYDDAGNILTRTEYAYTTGTVGTALDTVVYTYGDSGWGDLLTAYDGQTITYDGIGNPLTDGTWTYTWEHGRQLASMSGTDIGGEANDVSVSYTYNADGLRTSKTVTTKVYHTHSYTSTVVAPTCTSTGYTLHTCDCGDSYQDSETEMLPHSYTSTTVEPTCTEDGYTSYVCACGASYQETISALGHNYTETVVEPTTDAEGYILYTCSLCGDSYTAEYVPHTHAYTATVVSPTCEEEGYTIYACDCGYSYKDDYTDVIEHNFIETVLVEPTCTETGYAIYECGCGVGYDAVLSELGHIYDQYPITMKSKCLRCGYSVAGTQSVGETAEVMAASSTDDRVLESTIVQTYTYYYNGDLLRYMTVDGCSLYFVYDANGKPLTVTYRDGTNSYFCYYVTNPQGDVTAILDSTGTAVVQYYYDAWGNILSTTGSMADTLGEYNPLRYRSYVYDTETGLYYLQSRYYNPETGRFINADGYVSTGQGVLGNNMFAYCNNNPVCCSDPTGELTDGQIHNSVLARIILDYMLGGYYFLSMVDTMIYYNGENILNGWGFCDLYDTLTGEVWELKKDSSSYTCTTKCAKKQLGKYVNGRLASDPDLMLSRGGDLVFETHTYTISDSNGTYTITYWQECQGVLRYSYTFQKDYSNNNQAVQNARLACIAIAAPIVIVGFCFAGGTGAAAAIAFAAA